MRAALCLHARGVPTPGLPREPRTNHNTRTTHFDILTPASPQPCRPAVQQGHSCICMRLGWCSPARLPEQLRPPGPLSSQHGHLLSLLEDALQSTSAFHMYRSAQREQHAILFHSFRPRLALSLFPFSLCRILCRGSCASYSHHACPPSLAPIWFAPRLATLP